MWHTFAFILVIFSPAVLAQKPTKAPVDLQQLRKQIEQNQHEYINRSSQSFKERKQEYAVLQEYVNLAVLKIESFGNKSYLEKTRSQAYGDVLVTIELKSSGEISNVSIEKKSGHPELDEIAVSAVRSSAPFEPFEKWETIKFTKLFSFVSCTDEAKECSTPNTAALSMVETLGLGNKLGQMGLLVATRTQTFRMIAQEVGNEKAIALVKEDLENLLPTYQKQWNKNLAQSYAEHFDSTELRSIANEKQSSKYFAKFKSKKDEVGKSMQDKSSGMLSEYVTAAIYKSFARATK